MVVYTDMKATERRNKILEVLRNDTWCTTMYLAKRVKAASSLNLLRLDVLKMKKAGVVEVINIDHMMPHPIHGYMKQRRVRLIAVRKHNGK
jgi:hypothetical protein